MPAVHPYISYRGDCREAIEFYEDALGAEVVFQQTFGESPMADAGPADNIMHATIKVGDSTIMMSDDPSREPVKPGSTVSLAISLDDVQQAKRIFDRLAEGGKAIMPLEKTFWAEAFGMATDKFGVKWMVNCDKPQ